MRILPLFLFLAVIGLQCQSNENQGVASNNKRAGTEPNAAVAQTAKKSIVFFGNSLTAAYNLSPEQGYTHILQQRIDSLQWSFRCVNAGLSGETTTDGANRADWVLKQPVDVFVLELGGNDALRGLPVEDSRKNLQIILDKVKSAHPNARIVLAGMLAPPNLGPRYTNAFRDMYPALAKANGAALIPFFLDKVAGISALNLEDGIHPNAEGQKIVAENVWRVLEPILREMK